MSRSSRVLVVEDDHKTRDWLRLYLERAGHDVRAVADGAAALAAFESDEAAPDLVLLDVMLPGLDGFATCRAIRAMAAVPVILLTARASETDRLRGFDLGADDYIVKPFSPREVVARVQAVLRRAQGTRAADEQTMTMGPFTLQIDAREARAGSHVARLTPVECRLLAAMMRAPRRGYSRAELIDHARGAEFEGTERTVDVHVKNLRRKLERFGLSAPAIITLHGVGYRLEPPAS